MRYQGSTFPLRGQVLAGRTGSLRRPLTWPGSFHPAPVWFLLPVPRPGALLGPSSQKSAQPTSLSQPGAQAPAGPQAPHGDHCRVPRTATRGDRTIRWRRWRWRGRLLTLQGLSLASGPSWWGWSPAGQSSVCPRPPSSPTGRDRRVPGRRLYLPLTTLSAPRTMPCWP